MPASRAGGFYDTDPVDEAAVLDEVGRRFPPDAPQRAATRDDLLRCVRMLDLTSLRGDEQPHEIETLCRRALQPVPPHDAHVAAVCVVTRRVDAVCEALAGTPVRVAAACFDPGPGDTTMEDRLVYIDWARDVGADEVDVPITVAHAAAERWVAVYHQVSEFREVAGPLTLKVILGTGVLPTLTAVARASRVALDAGADFIKTSTGKEAVNATLPAGIVMARALTEHAARTGARKGLKPAGGIRTADAALAWVALADAELGDGWVTPERFRIGASGLLDDLAARLAAAGKP